jgi:hypothetical protein
MVSENARRASLPCIELRTMAPLQGAQTAVIGAGLATLGHADVSELGLRMLMRKPA